MPQPKAPVLLEQRLLWEPLDPGMDGRGVRFAPGHRIRPGELLGGGSGEKHLVKGAVRLVAECLCRRKDRWQLALLVALGVQAGYLLLAPDLGQREALGEFHHLPHVAAGLPGREHHLAPELGPPLGVPVAAPLFVDHRRR